MSLAVASFLLFAQQLQATCAPSGNPVEESEAVTSVRYFFELGNRRDFEAAASFVAPGAVGENSDGETALLIDMINDRIEEGDAGDEPLFILDTMSAQDTVAVKANQDGVVGIIVFELDGTCITRVNSFEK